MKKIVTIFCLCVAAIVTNAQSYKTHRAGVTYCLFPKIIQHPDINTFSVKLDMNEPVFRGYGVFKPNLLSMLKLNAFTTVDVNGENSLEINLSEPANVTTSIEEKVRKKDDKEYRSYSYKLTYMLPNYFKLRGSKSEIFLEGKVGGQDNSYKTYTYLSNTSFQTREQCANFYKPGQEGHRQATAEIAKTVAEIVNTISSEIKPIIDYRPSYGSETIYSIKSGKKGDFLAYDKAADQIEAAYALIKIDEDRSKFFTQAAVPISFWRSQIPTLDYKNKDQENIYTAVTINLATAYYWADKLDSCQFFIDLAKQTGDKKGDIQGLERLKVERAKDLEELKRYNIDPYKGINVANSNEISGNSVAALVKSILENPANFTQYQGSVVDKNGVEQKVTYKQYGQLSDPNVAKWSGKLMYKAVNSEQEIEVNSTNVKFYDIDGQKYEYVRFYPSTEVSAPIQQMIKIVFDSPKMRVYEYDAGNTGNLAGSVNVLYKRPSEDIATNTSSVKFLFMFKKSLAKYFADCPSVKAKAESGGFGKDRQQLLDAAKEYAECK